MDVINMISKVSGLPDGEITEPEAKYQKAWEHYINGSVNHSDCAFRQVYSFR